MCGIYGHLQLSKVEETAIGSTETSNPVCAVRIQSQQLINVHVANQTRMYWSEYAGTYTSTLISLMG